MTQAFQKWWWIPPPGQPPQPPPSAPSAPQPLDRSQTHLTRKFFFLWSRKWSEMVRKLAKLFFWHHDPPKVGGRRSKFIFPKNIFFQKWFEMAKNLSYHFLSWIRVQSRGPFWDNLFLFFLLLNLRWAQLYVSLVPPFLLFECSVLGIFF